MLEGNAGERYLFVMVNLCTYIYVCVYIYIYIYIYIYVQYVPPENEYVNEEASRDG
jgi:hypothetical protein